MGLARKRITAIVLLLALFSFLTVYIASTSTSQAFPTQKATDETTTLSSREVLAGLDLTTRFEYRRQCVIPRQRIGLPRVSYTNITGSFLVEPVELDSREVNDEASDEAARPLPPCSRRITIDVPATEKEHASGPDSDADTSSLTLGMATTLERLLESLPEMARWLSDTGSHLIVILLDQDHVGADRPSSQALALAKTLHIQLTVFSHTTYASSVNSKAHVSSDFETRRAKLDNRELGASRNNEQTNFGLARAFVDTLNPSTKWLAIIEDDTFFLSLPAVLRALRPFDPAKQLYIGRPSERASSSNSLPARSGAGIFLSVPLTRLLASQTSTCLSLSLPRPLPGPLSDSLWAECIFRLTAPTVQLSPLSGLNALDIPPDVSGWYESGTWPILSLHNWKTTHAHPIPIAHLVADVAGPASFLGRWAWHDENLVLTNGYSIAHYPEGIPDLRLVERTMHAQRDPDEAAPESDDRSDMTPRGLDSPPPVRRAVAALDVDALYRSSLGRLRPSLAPETQKRSWRLEHAVTEGGSVRQFYVRRARGKGSDAMDSVIEVDWIR